MEIATHKTINEYEATYISEIFKFIENYLDFNDVSSINYISSIVIIMHLEVVWDRKVTANNMSNQKVVALIEERKKKTQNIDILYNY